ncbi:MAG: DUF4974 domain-containing protein [Lentimicrobium sp.]|nr:DUF4974 domain-containing protein [Lentimicrobium sp.]
MEDKTTYYNNLIASYFSGEATPEEIELLSVWLTEDTINLKLFEEYQQTWLITGKAALSTAIDIDAEWNAINKRLKPDTGDSTSFVPKKKSGKLIHFMNGWKAAAAVAVFMIAVAALFYLNRGQDKIVIIADKGNLEQTLPDGSEISLRKGSVIEYAADFDTKERKVKLEGEAYFKVKRNEKRPFIVAGNNARIEVLGTSFNVNTKAGDKQISVILTSGKVSIYFKGNKSNNTILNPGEKAEISTTTKTITTVVNPDPNYLAWKNGKLIFDNTSLDQVIATLSNVYQKEIRLANQQLSGCSLTATFENQTLNSVLNVIKVTLGVEVTEENGILLINGSGC